MSTFLLLIIIRIDSKPTTDAHPIYYSCRQEDLGTAQIVVPPTPMKYVPIDANVTTYKISADLWIRSMPKTTTLFVCELTYRKVILENFWFQGSSNTADNTYSANISVDECWRAVNTMMYTDIETQSIMKIVKVNDGVLHTIGDEATAWSFFPAKLEYTFARLKIQIAEAAYGLEGAMKPTYGICTNCTYRSGQHQNNFQTLVWTPNIPTNYSAYEYFATDNITLVENRVMLNSFVVSSQIISSSFVNNASIDRQFIPLPWYELSDGTIIHSTKYQQLLSNQTTTTNRTYWDRMSPCAIRARAALQKVMDEAAEKNSELFNSLHHNSVNLNNQLVAIITNALILDASFGVRSYTGLQGLVAEADSFGMYVIYPCLELNVSIIFYDRRDENGVCWKNVPLKLADNTIVFDSADGSSIVKYKSEVIDCSTVWNLRNKSIHIINRNETMKQPSMNLYSYIGPDKLPSYSSNSLIKEISAIKWAYYANGRIRDAIRYNRTALEEVDVLKRKLKRTNSNPFSEIFDWLIELGFKRLSMMIFAGGAILTCIKCGGCALLPSFRDIKPCLSTAVSATSIAQETVNNSRPKQRTVMRAR